VGPCRGRGDRVKSAAERNRGSAPRLDLSGVSTSLGPAPAWPESVAYSRPASSAASAVFVEGVREAVRAEASAGAVLQRGLPAGGPALACVACPASVSGHGAEQGLPLPAEPPVSGALPSATLDSRQTRSVSERRASRRVSRATSPGGRFRLFGRARGSARSAVFKKIFVQPAWLLHRFRSSPAFPVTEVLLPLVPPCLAARAGT